MSSSPITVFEVEHAVQYGVDAACLLYHFRHWIEINHIESRNEHEGKTWTYQSHKALLAHFPWLSNGTLCRTLDILCSEKGPLVKGNFNKLKMDRTVWYAFKNQDEWIRKKYKERSPKCEDGYPIMGNALTEMDYASPMPISHNGLTIPDISKTDNKPKNEESHAIARDIALELKKLIERNEGREIPDATKIWAKDIEKLIRVDKYDKDEVLAVLRWSQNDSFWHSNILSGRKLRAKFIQLRRQMAGAPAPPRARKEKSDEERFCSPWQWALDAERRGNLQEQKEFENLIQPNDLEAYKRWKQTQK